MHAKQDETGRLPAERFVELMERIEAGTIDSLEQLDERDLELIAQQMNDQEAYEALLDRLGGGDRGPD